MRDVRKMTPHDIPHCRELIARRDDALNHGATAAEIDAISKELGRAAARAKKNFLLRSVNEENWAGIRRLKPFRANHTRIRDEGGRSRPAQDRAEILATHYEKVGTPDVAWCDADRNPISGAAFISDEDFTPTELRAVKNG